MTPREDAEKRLAVAFMDAIFRANPEIGGVNTEQAMACARIAADFAERLAQAEREACIALTAAPVDIVTGGLPNADEIAMALESERPLPWAAAIESMEKED